MSVWERINRKYGSIVICIITSMILTACGGGSGSGDNGNDDNSVANVAPVAQAGADQEVEEQTEVTLSGSGTDSDGSVVSYNWTQTAGMSVTLTSAESATASFSAPDIDADETLTFELTVTDDDGATDSDTVSVMVRQVGVENSPPIANAGIDQSVDEFSTVTLSGSATDTDDSIVSYQWTQLSGDSVVLINADSDSASFTAPDVSSSDNLTFQLTVTDDDGAEGVDSVTVTVNPVSTNTPPTADAGVNQAVAAGSTVTLDGTGSSDAESTNLNFNWTQTSGSIVTLSLSDQAVVTFVAPNSSETLSFELTVTDEEGSSSDDTVNVIVKAAITEKMNDTGVILCSDYAYDGGSESHNNYEDCLQLTDDDGDPIPEGQDADYGRDKTANDDSDGHAGFSFTKLDAEGNSLSVDAVEWNCVQDNVTGLIWEVKTDDDGLRDKDNKYTWFSSDSNNNAGLPGEENGGDCSDTGNCDTEKYVAQVNAGGLCGANDWRLPNREELRSIVNYGINSLSEPTIDLNYFPNTEDVSPFYWTSSPWAYSSNSNFTHAWTVHFGDGKAKGYAKDTGVGFFVRLVRTQN
ncbi:MAG: DUF1566 domain-containing protein [Gammaproteobacteria bacterium]|nr:DUF1566 domain-containing protein [Gammaproteobacteria bacterium]